MKIMLLHPSPRWLQHAPEHSRPFQHPAPVSDMLNVGMATKSARFPAGVRGAQSVAAFQRPAIETVHNRRR